MKTAYLGLGSNLGDRSWYLAEAIRRLGADTCSRVMAVSSVYETKPMGVLEQGDFLNLVLELTTDAAPEALLGHCLGIETDLGRVRKERWGPRSIDIDILWYEGAAINSAELILPHPSMLERSFVLSPLAEIAPNLSISGHSVKALAARLDQSGIRRLGAIEHPTGTP